MQMYGEYHILTSRLYINIGIVYEDNNDFKKAYEYFKKWARVSEEILGPDHPKTQRAKGVLRETRYRRIAKSLGELEAGETLDNTEVDSNEDPDESLEQDRADVENFQSTHSDLERYCEDDIDINEGPTLNNSGSSASIEQNNNNDNVQSSNVDRNTEENSQALMNGYSSELPVNSSSNDDSSEDMHDDQSELYAEDYILNAVSDPVIEEFNVNLEDSEDEDDIVQLATQELNIGNIEALGEHDNRYEDMWEGHESSDPEENESDPINRQLTRDRN